jgi:hypothetical protein
VVKKEWKDYAYPLQQIVVKIQGRRNSYREDMIHQLELVIARLRSGEDHGADHDDDFGYVFEVAQSEHGPSFFDEVADSY